MRVAVFRIGGHAFGQSFDRAFKIAFCLVHQAQIIERAGVVRILLQADVEEFSCLAEFVQVVVDARHGQVHFAVVRTGGENLGGVRPGFFPSGVTKKSERREIGGAQIIGIENLKFLGGFEGLCRTISVELRGGEALQSVHASGVEFLGARKKSDGLIPI